jgi:hypothetical protein
VVDGAKKTRHVDTAMLWSEGREPPRRLLELPFTAGAVSTPGLVPSDRDVDEPLEEILLGRLGRAPDVLQRLMGLEVLAPPDLRQSCRESILHERECYPRSCVATILLTGVDLFFRGKLEASLPAHNFIPADSAEPYDLVIADIARVDPDEVADAFPDKPILGYTNHADTAGLRRAHEAGFDQVVAKSALVERAPQLVDQLIA